MRRELTTSDHPPSGSHSMNTWQKRRCTERLREAKMPRSRSDTRTTRSEPPPPGRSLEIPEGKSLTDQGEDC
jgi:hypothetical protein